MPRITTSVESEDDEVQYSKKKQHVIPSDDEDEEIADAPEEPQEEEAEDDDEDDEEGDPDEYIVEAIKDHRFEGKVSLKIRTHSAIAPLSETTPLCFASGCTAALTIILLAL